MPSAMPEGLDALETATHLVLSADQSEQARIGTLPTQPVRAALERCVRSALMHPPCLVAFSGGRDSSVLLALAQGLAIREGLPFPIAVTFRLKDSAAMNEDHWQELVVRHLGIADWIIREAGSDLDVVGPVAAAGLRMAGVAFPASMHFYSALAGQDASGGSLLTGLGGDELFTPATYQRIESVIRGRSVPRPRDVLRFVAARGPLPLRRLGARRIRFPTHYWLRPAAQQAFLQRAAQMFVDTPSRWDESRYFWRSMRLNDLIERSLSLRMARQSIIAVTPFADRSVVRAVGAAGAAVGYESRGHALLRHFGDLLPAQVLTRQTKALGNELYVTETARSFASQWDGGGLPDEVEEVVDVPTLRNAWRAGRVEPPQTLLLQLAWLSEHSPKGQSE